MSYYGARGDFYGRGGYYRGDPGFFSFVKKALPIAASFIPGVGGVIASGAASLLGGGGGGGGTPAAMGFSAPVQTQQPTISAAGSAAMAGRARGRGTMTGRLSGIARRALPTMAGAAAASLSTRGAAMPAGVPGVRMRRRHRMNVCNPRALRRAIRRAHGFERIAKQVIGFSSPHKRHGRVYFKRKRRSRR
jgi:hypothetical protein